MFEQDKNGHYRSGSFGTGKDYGTNKDDAAMHYFYDKHVKNSKTTTSGGCLGIIIIVAIFAGIGYFLKGIWEDYPWVYGIIGFIVMLGIVFKVRKNNENNIYSRAVSLINEERWTESKEYVEKLANKYKNIEACRILGNMYYEGKGVEQNLEIAKSWYKKACDYGDVGYSEYMQGFIISPDHKNTSDEAMEFIKQASKNESIDGIIDCVWRYSYRNNEKDAKDYKRALKALINLVEEKSFPNAQQVLGEAYEKGVVTNKDLEKAFSYYKMAAEQNFWPAMLCVERCYSEGIGVTKNDDEAKKWYDLAVNYAREDGIDLCIN